MVGARPRQSNAALDAGIDGKGMGSREGDPPGWVNIHGHVHQQDSPSSNPHINVTVDIARWEQTVQSAALIMSITVPRSVLNMKPSGRERTQYLGYPAARTGAA